MVDLMGSDQIRTYERVQSVVFLKTKDVFGGLSNMATEDIFSQRYKNSHI